MSPHFHEACEIMADHIERVLLEKGVELTAFPARRHDESGWHIGSVVDGKVLCEQFDIRPAIAEIPINADKYANALVDRVIAKKATLSARLPAYREWLTPCLFTVRSGLHLRFVQWPDDQHLRCDVLLGRAPRESQA